jgi:hypothetical protein
MALAVLCAETLFLWMFLAVAPLEQLADTGLIPVDKREVYRFAADWRHGMAGNAPLFMPGFLVIAATAWYAVAQQSIAKLAWSLTATLGLALVLAWLAAPIGGAIVLADFARAFGRSPIETVPAPAFTAVLAGVYTAFTWTTFVVASRYALRRRSVRPLAPVALLGIILAFARPWTVGDFTTLWTTRAATADPTATGSLLATIALGVTLALTERRPQPHLTHTAASTLRIAGTK